MQLALQVMTVEVQFSRPPLVAMAGGSRLLPRAGTTVRLGWAYSWQLADGNW